MSAINKNNKNEAIIPLRFQHITLLRQQFHNLRITKDRKQDKCRQQRKRENKTEINKWKERNKQKKIA